MKAAAVRGGSIVIAFALACSLLVVAARTASAAPVAPSAESLMVQMINGEREARGLPRLTLNLQMLRLGRQWAATMAARGRVEHRPDLAVAVDGDFDRLGENVGYTRLDGASDATLAKRLHDSFMASSGHRYHVLGRYNMVGVGTYRAKDGGLWVAVNFLQGPRDDFPLYRDLAGSPHEAAVERLFVAGLVRGCKANSYCPRPSVSRAQTAAVLQSATGSRQARSSVTQTCGSDSSCADEDVTRGELAVMVAAAMGLDPVEGNRFSDVSAADRTAVNAVAQAGILPGCSASRFCPNDVVSRARFATIMDRALRSR